MQAKYQLPRIKLTSLYRIFKYFGGHLRGHRRELILSAASLLGVAFLAALRPWPLKIVFDYVLLSNMNLARDGFLQPLTSWSPMAVLTLAAGSVLALAALKGILKYSQVVLTKSVGHSLVAAIRIQLFSHIQRLPQTYHDYCESGDLITRMTGDISILRELLVSTVINLASELILIISCPELN